MTHDARVSLALFAAGLRELGQPGGDFFTFFWAWKAMHE